MKQLYLGNEAVARGLYEAGVPRWCPAYPGTPSTEITEARRQIPRNLLRVGPQREGGHGGRLRRRPSAGHAPSAAMKHVGLNVAADPLFTADLHRA